LFYSMRYFCLYREVLIFFSMRKITVHAVPNSKEPGIIKIDDGTYRVKINAPSKEGKANALLAEMLAEYFKVSKSSVKIENRYKKSKIKIIKIK